MSGKHRAGQTLVETSIAIGVITIVVAALIAMGISAMRSSSFSKNRIIAEKVANEALEAMRGLKNATAPADFNSVFNPSSCYQLSSGTPRYILPITVSCASYQNYTTTPYQYKISVADTTQNGVTGKTISVGVTFLDSGGMHETSMQTFFTNW
ncbi:MAG: hypothetical protein AAB486_05050 [Patescibacteria group bacterium]